MKSEYVEMIAEVDNTLSTLREEWMKSAPADRVKWRVLIDKQLDQRVRLMKKRDEE